MVEGYESYEQRLLDEMGMDIGRLITMAKVWSLLTRTDFE